MFVAGILYAAGERFFDLTVGSFPSLADWIWGHLFIISLILVMGLWFWVNWHYFLKSKKTIKTINAPEKTSNASEPAGLNGARRKITAVTVPKIVRLKSMPASLSIAGVTDGSCPATAAISQLPNTEQMQVNPSPTIKRSKYECALNPIAGLMNVFSDCRTRMRPANATAPKNVETTRACSL